MDIRQRANQIAMIYADMERAAAIEKLAREAQAEQRQADAAKVRSINTGDDTPERFAKAIEHLEE